MNKKLGITLVVIGGLVMSALFFGAVLFLGHSIFTVEGYSPFNMTMAPAYRARMGQNYNKGYSMMGGSGYNMMGGSGYNMMGGSGYNMMGGSGYNMMPYNQSSNPANAELLTIDLAKQVIEDYLKGLNNSDLEVKEIMIFDNNGYARIIEKSTGIGAMELLVDPTSLSVFPEYGPNMMWNLKYGHMNGAGGIMGGLGTNSGSVSATMTVTSEQAIQIAQGYLDQQSPGYQTAEEADPFYGYYTMDILKDDVPTGMMSVNGFSGQVFLHTWHGNFIEMFE